MKPRLGLFGARADNGGLGAQTWEYFRWLKPSKTLVVDISDQTNYTNHFERYPGATIVHGHPTDTDISDWLVDIDVIIMVEAPYNYEVITVARQRGIKTILIYNYEFLGNLHQTNLPKPDLFLAPSPWYMEDVKRLGAPVEYMHVPVNRDLFPFKQRKQAKKFLHIAGHSTFKDRNGTDTVIQALPYIKSDVEIVIRSQGALPRHPNDSRVNVEIRDAENYYENYDGTEDVLLLPRKYGGLSLQLHEAMSLGMIPIMTNIEPQRGFLSDQWMVPANHAGSFFAKSEIDYYECTPQALAEKIDFLAGLPPQVIEFFSNQVNDIIEQRNWHVMKPQYEALFERLCQA